MADHGRVFYIPIELAEMLHATLGPLADVLEEENHQWVPMLRKVLSEYTRSRDRFLTGVHGDVIAEIVHHTYLAAEKVCGMTKSAIIEERDFSKWAAEFTGESETA